MSMFSVWSDFRFITDLDCWSEFDSVVACTDDIGVGAELDCWSEFDPVVACTDDIGVRVGACSVGF